MIKQRDHYFCILLGTKLVGTPQLGKITLTLVIRASRFAETLGMNFSKSKIVFKR